jgi:hypothetical protein
MDTTEARYDAALPTTAEDLRTHHSATVDLFSTKGPSLAGAFNMSRTSVYTQARNGTLPVEPIRIGHRLKVSVSALLRLLDEQ